MLRAIVTILTLLLFGSLALAQTTKLKSAIPGSGASKSESTNFALKPAIGQAIGGGKTSSTFGLRPFFIPSPTSTSSADPFISGFTPDRGKTGSVVTILGGNFGSDESAVEVLFGTINSPSFSLSSSTQIAAEVPGGISGPFNITVSVSGNSTISASQFTIIPPPQIQLSSDNAPSFEDGSQSAQLRLDVTHDYEITNVVIRFRALRAVDATWQTEDATAETPNGNTTTYFYDLQSGSVDELGVVYTFIATDEVDNVVDIGENYLYRSFPVGSEPSIPLSFGGAPENWRMFSIPYETDSRSVSTLFSAYGTYDGGRGWRIVRWNEGRGDFDEIGTGSIQEGKGYWFNAKEQKTITVPNASSPRVTEGSPKSIILDVGWTQIGNPYPFEIDWSDVLADPANSSVSNIGNLRIFRGTSLSDGDGNLRAWEGAYVRNDNTVQTNIQIPFRSASGLRSKGNSNVTNSIDEPHWEVLINLESGIYSNTISKLGMHPEASDEKDLFDESPVPRLGSYLDLNFDINEKSHSASLRSTKNYDSWEFTLENNLDNEWVQLTWDNSYFGENPYQLILHDLENERLIDMRAENNYSYRNTPQRKFRAYYGTSEELESSILPSHPILGQIYPNPFNSWIVINYTLASQQRKVEIRVYDMMGHKIKTLFSGAQEAGFYQREWDSQNLPVGVYLVRMTIKNDLDPSDFRIDTKRIVKQ